MDSGRKIADRHETCVHAEACDRMASMAGDVGLTIALNCDACAVYDSQHCPMSLSGTMRCKGMGD